MIWAISLFVFAASLLHPGETKSVIKYPNAHTTWRAGEHHHVVWDTSDPAVIANKVPKLFLMPHDLTTFEFLLAEYFDLSKGRVEIQVPEVEPGSYHVVLFGLENMSDDFEIS